MQRIGKRFRENRLGSEIPDESRGCCESAAKRLMRRKSDNPIASCRSRGLRGPQGCRSALERRSRRRGHRLAICLEDANCAAIHKRATTNSRPWNVLFADQCNRRAPTPSEKGSLCGECSWPCYWPRLWRRSCLVAAALRKGSGARRPLRRSSAKAKGLPEVAGKPHQPPKISVIDSRAWAASPWFAPGSIAPAHSRRLLGARPCYTRIVPRGGIESVPLAEEPADGERR